MDEKELGKRLQVARQKAGLTQQELCAKANLSISTLAKIERGAIKAPSIFTVASIAAVVGTPLETLVGSMAGPTAPVAKKRSKSGVRFIYFDVNGVLVRFFHRAFVKIAEDTGAPPDVTETAFWHYNDEVCRGAMSMDEFNRTLAEQLGVSRIEWQDYYFASIDSITEMHEVVKWAAEHYEIGLLTNIMPGFIEHLMKEGWIPSVDYRAIIDSSKVGAVKPERLIFETAQAQSGFEPHEILLIDDGRANIMAAEHLGWKVLWFDDYYPSEGVQRVRAALEF